jgi:2-amino-4-hydroxy-6-hydroxymethyldihydropteridine diphosphokinase
VSTVVLSIGSNMGDRMEILQSAIDALAPAVCAVSPVYETEAWGGVEQAAFLNAAVIATDDELDCRGWLRRAQQLESAAGRVRNQRWGPRTLDVDLITCRAGGSEVFCCEPDLTLPHPLAHRRAFVLIPWLAIEPEAELTVAGAAQPVAGLLAGLDRAERAGVRSTPLVLGVSEG